MNDTSGPSQIFKKALADMHAGEAKDTVFNRYKDEVDSNTLATKIAFYPDREMAESGRKYFKVFTICFTVYIGSLFLTYVWELSETVSFSVILSIIISILIYFTLLFFSQKKHFMSFRIVMILGFKELLSIGEHIDMIGQLTLLKKIHLVFTGSIILTLIILSLIITQKIYPHMKFLRPKYHKEGGPMYKYYPEETGI